MGVICPVCDFENPQEDAQVCEQCGEDLTTTEGKFQKPLRILKEIGQKVAESAGSFPRDKLEGLYSHVVELVQDVLDESQQKIEKNLTTLREKLKEASEVSGDEVNLTGFVDGFHFAQGCINEGIGMALSALMNMKSFKDVKSGQHQLELAVTRVQAGLQHLEKLSLASAGIKIPDETTPEIPIEVMIGMDHIEKALEGLARFTDKFQVEDLRATVHKLDEARSSLGAYLKRIDEGGELGASAPASAEGDQQPAAEGTAEVQEVSIQPGSLDIRH